VRNLLGNMLTAGKLPSSLLFTGPEGSGKELMALHLAGMINCEAPGHETGDRCASCAKLSTLEYPDLHLVYAIPSGPPEKSIPVLLESRREDFLSTGEFSGKARSIGIGQVRTITEKVSRQPFEGKRTLVILCEAHLATIEAQNAFLKLLEEPPASTILILVTEFTDRLLPTIRSRCQEVRFDFLPQATIAGFLETFYSVEKLESEKIASMAAGSVRRAIRLLDKRFLDMRNDSLSILRMVLEGKARRLPAEAESAAREYSREETGQLFGEMISVLRDLMRMNEGGLDENGSRRLDDHLGAAAIDAAADRDIPADIRKIETAARNLGRNVDVELTMIQLMLDLAGKWY
jgi:DNA polymerase-3 subunit delta'